MRIAAMAAVLLTSSRLVQASSSARAEVSQVAKHIFSYGGGTCRPSSCIAWQRPLVQGLTPAVHSRQLGTRGISEQPLSFYHRETTSTPKFHRSGGNRRQLSKMTAAARDFFLEIEDADAVRRRVHVFDGGPYMPQDASAKAKPPLVLIGGTAQVIASWVGHINQLAKDRRLILIEARGQGKTELSLQTASIEQHVLDFERVMQALAVEGPVDLCGFSFGGRVVLAVAATKPHLANRLVATGVPADRDAMARLILRSWRDTLQAGHMQAFAWNSMLQCHGREFLSQYEAKIPEWVDFVAANNRPEAILSILTGSHVAGLEDPWHTLNLAARVQCPTLLISGSEDRIAPLAEVHRLSKDGSQGKWPVIILQGSGHNCVFEQPAQWRKALLSFLD